MGGWGPLRALDGSGIDVLCGRREHSGGGDLTIPVVSFLRPRCMERTIPNTACADGQEILFGCPVFYTDQH